MKDLSTTPRLPLLEETSASPLPAHPRLFALLLMLLFMVAGQAHAAHITDYRVVRQPVVDPAGKVRVAIRNFQSDGVPHLLVVDPDTLKTYDVPSAGFQLAAPAVNSALRSTRYFKAVERYTGGPFPLQNSGATRADAAVDGVCLTVDLCPSKRPFEREMFDLTGALGGGAPVPVAIAITGVWLSTHPAELSYLKREVEAGRLDITWVNHSHHHPYEPKVPLAENFLLTPGTDFTAEVLDVERQLLANGLVPSPFFRFPGLVSDRATITRLRELSLIPVGSDAWLAKGENPRKGSFILVHGNGNEPKGIKLLLPMLRKKELRLLPLTDAFAGSPSAIIASPQGGAGNAGGAGMHVEFAKEGMLTDTTAPLQGSLK